MLPKECAIESGKPQDTLNNYSKVIKMGGKKHFLGVEGQGSKNKVKYFILLIQKQIETSLLSWVLMASVLRRLFWRSRYSRITGDAQSSSILLRALGPELYFGPRESILIVFEFRLVSLSFYCWIYFVLESVTK